MSQKSRERNCQAQSITRGPTLSDSLILGLPPSLSLVLEEPGEALWNLDAAPIQFGRITCGSV